MKMQIIWVSYHIPYHTTPYHVYGCDVKYYEGIAIFPAITNNGVLNFKLFLLNFLFAVTARTPRRTHF